MKAEFTNTPLKNSILITPEGEEETEKLRRWDNSVLSTKYNHATRFDLAAPSLLIIKEI